MQDNVGRILEFCRGLGPDATWESLKQGTMYATLVASECYLLDAYYQSIGQQPPGCDDTGGSMELGPVLYFLNNPPSGFPGTVVKAIVDALQTLEGAPLPPSRISTSLWGSILKQAEGGGIVAMDGTIFGEGEYEQLDVLWVIALLHFIYYQVEPDKVHAFQNTPQIITPSTPGPFVTLGVVGDWGTGPYGADGGPALAVANDLQAMNPRPDYLVHLGDVYYAGTATEEQSNLINPWPASWGPGTNSALTLNSNHEMYGGANGYFGTALQSNGPFSLQAGTSYFALQLYDWVILGLDSGYYASPDSMYMVGSIGPATGTQACWIAEHFAATQGKNVIVMTHHNPMDITGQTIEGTDPSTRLWEVVCGALGGPPAYWYYGHVHNGVVYSDQTVLGTKTKARLLGHGAIPFGDAWGLQPPTTPSGVVEYYAHTPVAPGSVPVQNGFATLTLSPNGGITEQFYELSGTPGQPRLAWSSD